jgi:hypothetical protein
LAVEIDELRVERDNATKAAKGKLTKRMNLKIKERVEALAKAAQL